MKQEVVLDVFPSHEGQQRLVVVKEICDAGVQIVLRQESFSEHVGWFAQSRVCVEPGQLWGLKTLLTGQSMKNLAVSRPVVERSTIPFPQAG